MSKHAYLIIAHHQFELLCKLLTLIDDVRNDIFIHIDGKADHVPYQKIEESVGRSKLYFTSRTRVKWGGYSEIKSEIILLKAATKQQHYDYYHLLSGADLPLVNQDKIHNFFDLNQGMEFVQFQKSKISEIKKRRVKYFYLFQEHLKKKAGILAHFQEVSLRLQELLRINRISNTNIEFQMGSNWFSITDNFARLIVANEKMINETFRYTKCCDEIFIQTILVNSSFKNYIYERQFSDSLTANQRFIHWSDIGPQDLTMKDLDQMYRSGCLFARKFNLEKDRQVVTEIESRCMTD